jgi:HSP20 family molecular chaperone IbpA
LTARASISYVIPKRADVIHFKNGVLTVTLPKRPEAQKSEKKIAINKV